MQDSALGTTAEDKPFLVSIYSFLCFYKEQFGGVKHQLLTFHGFHGLMTHVLVIPLVKLIFLMN